MIGLAPVVHVRDETAGVCRPGIVLAMPYGAFDDLPVRVLNPSRIGAGDGIGADDLEGRVAPTAHPTYVDTPDGTRRALDHWHIAEGCQYRP